jgi:hypothetical protein
LKVLTGKGFTWYSYANGKVPADAVAAGKSIYGELLFIGRAREDFNLKIGTIVPSDGCIYISNENNMSQNLTNYEVLVPEYSDGMFRS